MADRRPADPGQGPEPGDAGPASDADSRATGPDNSGGSPPSRTSARSAEGPPAGAARRRSAEGPPAGAARRRPRRDAELNRERVLAAAVSAMLREGRNVPLATIATEARVGVGTLYRSYADREALLRALEHRAYALLNQILDDIDHQDLPGLESVREFLLRSLAIGDQLILPLHGAPPLISAQAVAARQEINRRLDRFIERGRSDGSIRAAVNATDVIVFSATITQPLPHGPDWPLIAGRQLAIFVNGLAVSGPTDIPGPAVTRQDIETTFTLSAPPAEGK
jgi:AcrR family transcriptional regulator